MALTGAHNIKKSEEASSAYVRIALHSILPKRIQLEAYESKEKADAGESATMMDLNLVDQYGVSRLTEAQRDAVAECLYKAVKGWDELKHLSDTNPL